MSLDEIKAKVATALDGCDEWFSVLDHTTPGHYGVDDLSFRVASRDLWVEVPSKKFYFEKGALSFVARLGASREEDSVDARVSKVVSGSGSFRLTAVDDVEIDHIEINEHISLP